MKNTLCMLLLPQDQLAGSFLFHRVWEKWLCEAVREHVSPDRLSIMGHELPSPKGSNSVLHFILFSLNMMMPLVLLFGISRSIQNKNSVVGVFVLEVVSSISIISFSLQYK